MKPNKIVAVVAALFTSLAVASCSLVEDLNSFSFDGLLGGSSNSSNTPIEVDTNTALESLNYLFVNDHPRAPKYDREAQFGQAWTDDNTTSLGGNGCDTRNDILARDLEDVIYADSKECVVATGTLENDPYTGRTINFRRGTTTSRLVQIEHIVALKNAWESGAWQWSQQERIDYANDPSVLIAVDGPANQGKQDKSADQWLVPDNPGFRCAYAAMQVSIKDSYGLSVTTAEKNALRSTLTSCAKN